MVLAAPIVASCFSVRIANVQVLSIAITAKYFERPFIVVFGA
jgi:hypothetical protein